MPAIRTQKLRILVCTHGWINDIRLLYRLAKIAAVPISRLNVQLSKSFIRKPMLRNFPRNMFLSEQVPVHVSRNAGCLAISHFQISG